MAGEKIDITVADLLLAHGKVSSLSSVGAIYQKFQWIDERRDALERWTGFLAMTARKPPPGPWVKSLTIARKSAVEPAHSQDAGVREALAGEDVAT